MTLVLPEPKARKRGVRPVLKHRDKSKYVRKEKHKAAHGGFGVLRGFFYFLPFYNFSVQAYFAPRNAVRWSTEGENMVFPTGTAIHAGAVVVGGCIGMLLGNRLPDRMRLIVFQGLGLCTMAIGVQMTFKTTNPLYMVGSILLGAIIGEALRLEEVITSGGDRLKRALRSGNAHFTDGFVAATLLFCIGSMAILGSLQEGIGGDRTIVLTKTTLDFFAAIALGAVYGSGVMFASLPILLYQGGLTLFAEAVSPWLSNLMRAELEATGGIMVLGIGFNLLEIKKIPLSNFLPALVVVVVLCLLGGITA
jgi:uncharacterized membrane protein YqgA involved in biofilm formation